jgi:hypothetical protein
MIRTARGGTQMMRDPGTLYLPVHPTKRGPDF